MKASWSEERIALLRELASSNLSLRAIGDRMTELLGIPYTRNMVRWKLRDLRIVRQHTRRKVSELVDADAIRTHNAALVQAKNAMAIQTQDSSFSILKNRPEEFGPPRYTGCQFPIGEPRRDGFRLCNNSVPLGRPYCDAHYRICFISSSSCD